MAWQFMDGWRESVNEYDNVADRLGTWRCLRNFDMLQILTGCVCYRNVRRRDVQTRRQGYGSYLPHNLRCFLRHVSPFGRARS